MKIRNILLLLFSFSGSSCINAAAKNAFRKLTNSDFLYKLFTISKTEGEHLFATALGEGARTGVRKQNKESQYQKRRLTSSDSIIRKESPLPLVNQISLKNKKYFCPPTKQNFFEVLGQAYIVGNTKLLNFLIKTCPSLYKRKAQ